jgi:hypothetical protein
MASEIKSDKLSPSTGTALQIGDASDTITIPTGATFTITDGLGVAAGGTGLSSFTAGDVLYATGTTTLAKLAKGTAEQVLSMNSGATAPEWATAAATAGGTGQTGFTAGDLLYANSTTTLTKLGKGTGLQGLQTNSGATAPEWTNSPQSLMTAAGDILYASGANTLAKLAKGSDDEVLTLASGVPSWAAAGGGTGKKMHHFTMATRTAGSSSIGDQFTITSSFIPLDPVNNDLFCICAVPTISNSQDASGFGLRFSKSGGSDYDNFGKGVQYPDISHNAGMSIASQYFNIPAGTIPAGTYTIKLRNETASSQSNYYNPNSTDESRLATQTQTELMIQEWKNS